jgi:dTDP-4-amino-4,6-dideoxygalactose transaminase
MIPLSRPYFGSEELGAVREVLETGWVAQGPTTARFEQEFAELARVSHAIATSSCTTALHLAVVAGGIGPGDEVILPSFTFPATANAVLYERGVPVLVDIERDTLNIDVEAARRAINSRTKAIVGVHLFGFPCEIEKLRELARDKGLFLVEDAACAIGTEIEGRPVGGFGDLACFSFHGRKIVTCGEGGMLTTDDAALAAKLRSLRTHGASEPAEVKHQRGPVSDVTSYVRLGYNYRISDVQSAIARVQLRRLESFVKEREALAQRYEEALDGLPLRLPPRRVGLRHSYQSFVVVLEKDAGNATVFRAQLAERGITTRVGTYAIHRQPYFPRELVPEAPLPFSEEAAERSVALPLFNGMTRADQEVVVSAVREILVLA